MIKELEYDVYYGRVNIDTDDFFNNQKKEEFQKKIADDCEKLETIQIGDKTLRAGVTYTLEWDEYEESECSGHVQIYFTYVFDTGDDSSYSTAYDFIENLKSIQKEMKVLRNIGEVVAKDEDIIPDLISDCLA